MRLARLDIPSRPEFVSLARLVVSTVADDRFVLTDDQLDDLKLAVSEACVVVIETHDPLADGGVSLSCVERDDGLEVWVDGPSDFGVSTVPIEQAAAGSDFGTVGHDLGMPLIGTLVDEVDVESLDGIHRLRMVVRAPRHEER